MSFSPEAGYTKRIWLFHSPKLVSSKCLEGFSLIRRGEHERCCGERSATRTVTRWRRGNSHTPTQIPAKPINQCIPHRAVLNNSNKTTITAMSAPTGKTERQLRLIQYVTKGSVISQPVFPSFLSAVLRGWL